MSCHAFTAGGATGFVCGPSVYKIAYRGRIYTVEYASYGGPTFTRADGAPWTRQPYYGELWEIGERVIWGEGVAPMADGDTRADRTGATVRRVW